jgi:DnaJ-class molecular chaperone
MQVKQHYYQILGIVPNASMEEIKEAYYKLAFLYHPDRNQNDSETYGKMLEINEAYDTLSKPIKRRDYDITIGYQTVLPKFKTGDKLRVRAYTSPFNDHIGVVDQEPVKGNFRYWYMVKFQSNGLASVGRFAEEQLDEVDEMSPVTNEKIQKINEAYNTLTENIQRSAYDIPVGYHATVPRFKRYSKVRVRARASPFNDHIGVVDQEPVKTGYRFWYIVKIFSNGVETDVRLAEEQLVEKGE